MDLARFLFFETRPISWGNAEDQNLANSLSGIDYLFYCGASGAKRHLGISMSVVCLSVRPSVCLSVCLSVSLSHFWFADIFFTLRDGTFIFGKCIPYGKTFPMVP